MGNIASFNKTDEQFKNLIYHLPPKDWIPKKHSILNTKYIIEQKLGSGSFGNVHLCVKKSTGVTYAIKFETKIQDRHLEYEKKVYDILGGLPGVPQVYEFGETNYRQFLIMDYLGKNLNQMLYYCGNKFSLKTVLMIADQLISRLEHVHSKSFIYRDVKPDNFVIGRGKNKDQIYIIDFGLSKLYRDFWTHKPNQYKNKQTLVGTSRYCSTNTHLGIEQSRRDDLESLTYMLIYLLKGRLPWQDLEMSLKTPVNDQICNLKIVTKDTVLCEGIPGEFLKVLRYCKNLEFDEKPNYSKLREIFRNLFLKRGYVYDYKFDWVVKKEKEKEKEFIQQKKGQNKKIIKKEEKEWVDNLFKNANERKDSISKENNSNLEEKEKNTNEENKKNNSKVEEKEKNGKTVYKVNLLKENIFKKLENNNIGNRKEKQDNCDEKSKIEKVNSKNQNTSKIETDTKEFKIEDNNIKKIQKLKTLTLKRKKRHNNKLKVLIEQKLNEKTNIIFTNREKLFSSFKTKEEHEKRKKELSLYFIRKEEISRDQHKYIYHKIHKIKNLLNSNPKIENPLIKKQFLLIQKRFKQKLHFNQILILHNQLKELKFMIDQRNESLKEKNSCENIIFQSQNLTLSTKKINKIKNDQVKKATNERVKKLFGKKIAVFDHIKKLDILQNDDLQKKKIKKLKKN